VVKNIGDFIFILNGGVFLKTTNSFILFYFLFKDFIYLFDRERHSEGGNTSRGSGRGRSRLPAEQEPDVGLDPRTLRS